MKKMLTALVAAATIAGAAVATSAPAEARWGGGWHGGRGGGWGWGLGGFAAGAIVGSALAAPYYYGGYGRMGITARLIHTMAHPASGAGYGMAMFGLAPVNV